MDGLIKMSRSGNGFVITHKKEVAEVDLHSFKAIMFAKDIPGVWGGSIGPLVLYLNKKEKEKLRDQVSYLLLKSSYLVNAERMDILKLSEMMSEIASLLLGETKEIEEFILDMGIFLPEDNSSAEWAVDDKTYNRQAYIDLAVMSTIMSAFIPIWGLYMHRIKNQVNTFYKESSAMSLLRHSDIMETDVMKKLFTYVKSIDKSDKTPCLLAHSCDVDALEALSIRAAVRKVSIHDITDGAGSNLISSIHKMVGSQHSSSRSAYFKDKVPPSGSDDGSGFTDQFFVTSVVSAGERAELRFATSDVKVIAGILFNEKYSKGELKKNIKIMSSLRADEMCHAKVMILKWIFCGLIIGSKGIDYLEMKNIRNLMAVAKTFLNSYKMHYLELLLVSRGRSARAVHISGTAPRNRLSAEILDELEVSHPYKRSSGGIKKHVLKNVAVTAIDDMIALISESQYIPGCIDLERLMTTQSSHGVLAMPRDIKAILGSLILTIEKRRVENE